MNKDAEILEKVRTLYENFPKNFWVCGTSRKYQLKKWLDELGDLLGYVEIQSSGETANDS